MGRPRRVGFVLRILAAVFWVAFGVVAGTLAGVIANVAVILLSLNGIREWKRTEAIGAAHQRVTQPLE